MSNEIAHRTPDQLAEQMEWSKAMAHGDMLPRQYRGNPANLMFACEYADALGIPRINALTSIHVIDGKPTASADLIASLVRKAGHKLRVEGDDTYAEVTIIRADDPDYVPSPVRWDEAKARKAGKWGSKGPWSNYPGAMLRSRAITEAARMWASDALYGVIYTAEEIGGDERPAPRPVESEVVGAHAAPAAPECPIPPDFASKIDSATNVEWLDWARGRLAQHEADWPDETAALLARVSEREQELAAERVDAAPAEEAVSEPTVDDAQATLADVLDAEVVAEAVQS
ncbi:hypothetical protein WKY82_09050 [Gordonia malaquae]|uniref:hypothetical protein n=1 Tax=Gordonia malaquae TaxID=410332 RepID=UPI0030C785B9